MKLIHTVKVKSVSKFFLTALLLSLVASSGSAHINPPYVHWPLSVNANDVTANGHNGTLIGNGTFEDISSDNNRRFYCTNSSSNYIRIESDIKIDSTKGLSIAFWSSSDSYHVYKNAVIFENIATSDVIDRVMEFTSKQEIILAGQYYTIVTDLMFYNEESDSVMLNRRDYANSPPLPIIKINHHTIIIKPVSGTQVKIENYLNGESRGSRLLTTQLKSTISNIRFALIGSAHTAVTVPYCLRDLRIYNSVLTNSEIRGLANWIIDGLEDEKDLGAHSKTVIRSIDLLGREILNPDSYSGFAILIFSDGSKQKVLK